MCEKKQVIMTLLPPLIISTLRKVKKGIDQYTSLHFGIVLFDGQISFRKYRKLKTDLAQIKKQAVLSDIQFPITKLYPCYADSNDEAGVIRGHYFHQDLFVAQRIYINNPIKHVDIGSRIDGFVAHVAAFRKIEIFDIRPIHTQIQNICFKQTDLMKNNSELVDYTDSISCLHALEHFGLGRYDDPVCFDGYLLGFKNITRMLKRGGKFYFSVPFGKQRIEFHAHRVFSLKYLIEILSPYYQINSFSYVDDLGDFHLDIQISSNHLADNFNCQYGCAIFELTKK
jgi:hypothetical protein